MAQWGIGIGSEVLLRSKRLLRYKSLLAERLIAATDRSLRRQSWLFVDAEGCSVFRRCLSGAAEFSQLVRRDVKLWRTDDQ